MDQRLEKALDVANFMMTFNNQRKLLKQQFESDLQYHKEGHRFIVTMDLINFIQNMIDLNLDNTILIDANDTPYQTFNLKQMRDDMLDVYFRATNRYHQKFNELKKTKTIENILSEEE